MANNIAIRLGVEGGAEVKRTLEDAGKAGQAAFLSVGAAADASGAAVDRQTAKWERLAKTARDAEAQSRAQANINSLLGVGSTVSSGSARLSAVIFEEAARESEAAEVLTTTRARIIADARTQQTMLTSQLEINQRLGVTAGASGSARASAAVFEEQFRQEEQQQKRLADLRASSARNAASGWDQLAQAGRRQLDNTEAARRLGNMSTGTGSVAAGRRLRSDEATNLMYQGGDIVAQLGSGSPLSMIAMQQGPQIAQIFAGPGGASVKGAVTQAGEAMGSFARRVGVVGGSFGAVTTAAVVGVTAMVSYQNSVRETERMVSGVGRASGVTAAQIGVYARAASDATGISTRSAREAGGEIASTGRVGGEMVAKLVGSLKDYAKTTGQETAAASQDLAKAFADPAKGADLLNERLGFLDDRTAQTIRRLQEQGDRVGAQRILFDAYSSGLSKAAEVTSAWGRVSEAVTSSVSDAWDRLGQHVDRVVTGGSLEDRIETARKVLAESEELQQSGIGRVAASVFGQDPARDRAALDALLRQQDERTQRAARASAAQNSREIGDMVRQLDPVGSAVSETQGRVERLRKAISDPLKFGLDPTQLAQTQSAFERLSVLARNTREDIEKFGDPAIAAANRQAESRNRLVTSEATPVERQIAELRDKYDADLRSRNIDPTATRESVAKPYNDRINDPNLDSRETSAIAAAREVALRAITEREGLTRTLNTEIDTIKKEAESRASRSQNVSSYMERAIGVESGGDPTAKNRMSTATGLGQFLEGTWIPLFKKVFPDRAAGMSDREILARRTDAGDSREVLRVFTEQNARFLEKQNVATTDRNLYLAHFAGAQGAADLLNADRGASAESILGRRAAVANPTIIGGGRTAGDVINYADRVINKNAPAVRASDREVASIRTQITLTDQTTEAEARRQKIQELLNDDLQRGGALGRTYATAQHLLKASASQLTPELEAQRKVFIETADAYGKAQSGLESSRLGRDIMFDRAQIDRSQSEQNVASRLRGTGLGMDSAEADALRLNDNLRQTRDLANGAFSGMLGDLRQGATAITVIGNATSRFTDKLLSAASDRAISALFAGSGKDGGGFLSGVANLFGSASLPKFAEGGVSNGPSIFGEAGPEAAVPLSRGRSIPVELRVPRVQPMAPANFNQPAVVFSPNIINQAPNTEIATREVPDGRGGKREEILIREAFVRGASTRQGQQDRKSVV